MYGFRTNVAVAISNAIIFVGGITRLIFFEFYAQHPMKKAKIIDYGIAILMLPCVMMGSFIGVQLNVITPSAIILLLLGSILCFVSYRSLMKALELYRKDK